MQCSKCNNELKTRMVSLGHIGPYCRERFTKETYCPYCEWKGDSGAGKELKELISKLNKGE